MPAPSPYLRGLLPWESREAFDALRADWIRTCSPFGPAETSLVDQLVWGEWRRQRLVIGERAAHLAAAHDRLTPRRAPETAGRATLTADEIEASEVSEALHGSEAQDREEEADAAADEAMTRKAIALLATGDPAAYEEALGELRADTAQWWRDMLEDDAANYPEGDDEGEEPCTPAPYRATTADLKRFLEEDVLPFMDKATAARLRRPAIRLQLEGESLDAFRMERLQALDERLTRQFEKTLAMLLKLQAMRAQGSAGRSASSAAP